MRVKKGAESFLDDQLWILISQADVIAKAKVDITINQKDLKADSYLSFDASLLEVYKGKNIPDVISIKDYIYKDMQFPVSKMKNNEIIVFTVDYRHDKYSKCFYFIRTLDGPSFMIYSEDLVNKINRELKFQREVVKKFLESSEKFPNEEKIKTLIGNILNPDKAKGAYRKIKTLDKNSIPALIKYMNDRRELPIKHIQLPNKSKNAFEAYRHYSPQQVIDLIAAILNQMTGMSFGSIYNGGQNFQRQRVYHGWIVWLKKQEII